MWKHKAARQGALVADIMMTLLSWPSPSDVRSEVHSGEQGLSSCTEFCSPVYTHVAGSYKPRHGARARAPAVFQAS